MEKNSLIKYLVKEISQELKKEIKSIIREEFNNLNSKNIRWKEIYKNITPQNQLHLVDHHYLINLMTN